VAKGTGGGRRKPICLWAGHGSYGHSGKESAIMKEAERAGNDAKSEWVVNPTGDAIHYDGIRFARFTGSRWAA
jgi:hypothetical protein